MILRKAKAINVLMESQRPFKIVTGKWGHHCELPDGVKLPYYVLVNSSEGLDYLINICSIETNGIKITYRKLSADESELFRLHEKSKK